MTEAPFYREQRHPWVRQSRFQEVTAQGLLDGSKSASLAAKNGRPQAWIFDLDSTLFCTGSRNKFIYSEFLRQRPQAPMHWLLALGQFDPFQNQYSIRQTFEAIFEKYDSRLARAWSYELWKEFEPFWFEHFFSGRYLHCDTPYPGAVEFVHQVLKSGAEVIYLTGRDRPRNWGGTQNALRSSGFPMSENTMLLLKPDQEMTDLEYKDWACAHLKAAKNVAYLIENEPENLSMFLKHFISKQIVFFHSITSERVPPVSQDPVLRLLSFNL